MTDDIAASRPWLRAYPDGVPAEIDVAALPTLTEALAAACRTYAEKPAYESFGVSRSYAELERLAHALRAGFAARGVKPGDRVALMLPNVMAYPVGLYACLFGGFVVVNVNPLYTARELSHQLRDSGARVLIVLENFKRTVAAAQADGVPLDLVVVASAGDAIGLKGRVVDFVARYVKKLVPPERPANAVRLARILAEGRGRETPPHPAQPEDVAFLQYTGGTTAQARGAMLTHRNVSANLEQCHLWLAPTVIASARPQLCVTALPLYHIFALTANALLMARLGACCLLIANPRDLDGLVKTLKGRPFTIVTGVNTLFNALNKRADFAALDFSALVLAVAGGMSVQSPVATRWKAITGKPIIEGYGLSETSPVLAVNRPDIDEWTGTVGYPLSSTEIAIVDPSGRLAPPGGEGEIVARGPQVTRGYWNRPAETAAAMTADGFFRTGDVGVMAPDGAVRVVDRIKDMVIVSGFNVFPNEVEEVIAGCPGVAEVAVIGRPDASTGESVVALVVPQSADLTKEAVLAHCRANLAPYKRPRVVEFREALPKTNVGKILRRALREEVRAA
jgi:long-chain acyl-CoA synthetase